MGLTPEDILPQHSKHHHTLVIEHKRESIPQAQFYGAYKWLLQINQTEYIPKKLEEVSVVLMLVGPATCLGVYVLTQVTDYSVMGHLLHQHHLNLPPKWRNHCCILSTP